MRLFIAIDLDSLTKEKICELQKELKNKSLRGRWKHIDNFHLTLKFLGEVDSNRLTLLENVLKNICQDTHIFKIKLSKLGCFDRYDSIRTLWLGLAGDINKLNILNQNIEKQFENIGFKRERRPYSPHITIAQDVVFNERFDDIKKVEDKFNFDELVVDKIVLMESQEVEHKRLYTVIREFKLFGG